MNAFSGDLLKNLTRLSYSKTKRISSYDMTGKNNDRWTFQPGEKKIIADVKGPGCINHIWFTQHSEDLFFLRKVLIKIFWDGEKNPSIIAPVGDFFCLGHAMTGNFNSLPFTASTNFPHKFGDGVALNCYIQMPFNESARIEIVNECDKSYVQYFYIDYEQYPENLSDDIVYFHAYWHRENPTPGWGQEINVNFPESDAVNKGKTAFKNNYRILEAKGTGHYIGCNISVTNFHGTWWGEGDDMIWIDGYKWPPDLHGTGSEDYLNQAWGMQPAAYLFNGSSIYEGNALPPGCHISQPKNNNLLVGGYQTSYVFHILNPIRFKKEIVVSMESGHANHTCNDWSSTAYWYQKEPHQKLAILPVTKRLPVLLTYNNLNTVINSDKRKIEITPEMKKMKQQWKKKNSKIRR